MTKRGVCVDSRLLVVRQYSAHSATCQTSCSPYFSASSYSHGFPAPSCFFPVAPAAVRARVRASAPSGTPPPSPSVLLTSRVYMYSAATRHCWIFFSLFIALYGLWKFSIKRTAGCWLMFVFCVKDSVEAITIKGCWLEALKTLLLSFSSVEVEVK